jgi:amino acid adenylation domain-containing protein
MSEDFFNPNHHKLVDRYKLETDLFSMLDRVVETYPEKIAVKSGVRSLKFQELSSISNQAAKQISQIIEKDQQAIGLFLGHNVSIAPAILAVLKSRNYFVFMDTFLPAERHDFIVSDTGLKLIISDEAHINQAEKIAVQHGIPFFSIDQFDPGQEAWDIRPQTKPEDITQILYTSGSTGQPKGVIYSQRVLARFISTKINGNQLNPDCRSSLVTLFSFGGAHTTLLGSLLTGGTAIFFDFRNENLRNLKAWINTEKITHFQTTGTVFRQFLETLSEGDFFPTVELLRIGGEKTFPSDLTSIARHLPPKCDFGLGLASSETGSMSFFRFSSSVIPDWDAVPVGYPMDCHTIHILDENNDPISEGETGEIVIEGDSLALGYLNDPDLTKSKFRPGLNNPNLRAYRTGDLGKKLPNGLLQHVGRIDRQLKIKGVRIEPEGIENTLLSFPEVKNAAVIGWKNPSGEIKLVAYLQMKTRGREIENQLREFLRSKLPGTMWPSYYVFLDAFPQTPNGKLDRLNLPDPELVRPDLPNEHLEPSNQMESLLVSIWEENLGISGIGVEDKFFDLGGDSLTAAILFASIEEYFHRKLPLSTLMRAETIRSQGKILSDKGYLANWSPVVPIQTEGNAAPIFCFAGKGGNPLRFRALAELIGTQHPIYFMQSRGLDGKERPFSKVPEIAADFIQEIRKHHPEGPYHLIGSSFGGLVAYEIACNLRLQDVRSVVLLDTYSPKSLSRGKSKGSKLRKFYGILRKHFRFIFLSGNKSRKEYFRYYKDYLPKVVGNLFHRVKIPFNNKDAPTPVPPELREVEEANKRAAIHYAPPLLQGRSNPN